MSFTIAPPQPFLATCDLSVDSPALPTSELPSELTVTQAARMIGEPEGYINELLNAGLVEFRQRSGERLILRGSLLAHEAEYQRGLEGLAEITRLSQEMGLYDD